MDKYKFYEMDLLLLLLEESLEKNSAEQNRIEKI